MLAGENGSLSVNNLLLNVFDFYQGILSEGEGSVQLTSSLKDATTLTITTHSIMTYIVMTLSMTSK